MRDMGLALILAVLAPLGVFHPWMGVMLWTWVSLLSPHRMTYGFMYDFPIAMVAGASTLLGLIVSRDPKHLPMAAPLGWLFAFIVWMVICFPFALNPGDYNTGQLDKVLKIYLFTFIAVLVLWKRTQVDILVAVAVFSIAFFGIKGGIFTILTGGSYRVRGDGGFISGNNEIALALIMVIPLLYYFVFTQPNKWVKRALWLSMLLCAVAVMGTQSRGGLVGILGMTIAFIARSQRRARLIIPVLLMGVFAVIFMPESWWERMETIKTYKEDESAMGRINAWIVAWNVAKDNFFGGGFYIETQAIFDRYAPNHDFIAVAHSIYFQIMGQLGFVGLALYLGFWFSTWRTCRWVATHAKSPADQMLARMCEVSFVGFATGGAFLNMAYFDGPYYLMAALVVIRYKLCKNDPKQADYLSGAPAAAASQPTERGSTVNAHHR